MRLGLTIVGDTLANFIRYVQQADAAGVAAIGMGDSPTLSGEVWVRLQTLKQLGVEQIWSPVRFADKAPLMRAICDEFMPQLAQI